MSELNASVGIDFSLLGTNLHAAYEKKGAEGYAVLLLPTEQNANNGVSIGNVIDEIKKLVGKTGSSASTDALEQLVYILMPESGFFEFLDEERAGFSARIMRIGET